VIYTKEKIEELQHRWTTPRGRQLVKMIKSTRCFLSPVLFRQKVSNFPGINDDELKDGIDMRGISLAGFDFRSSVKGDDDYIEKVAILSNIHFEGANLKHCNFEGGKIHNCNFEHSDLSHAELKLASLNGCDFSDAECFAANFHGAKITDCDFKDASIKDISLERVLIDQHTTFGDLVRSEKEQNYHYASVDYKQIKEMYKGSSLHDKADIYHLKEMRAKRKLISKLNPLHWTNYIFGELLCSYGTSFVRVMIASLLFIFFCALLYTHNHSLSYYNQTLHASLADALYFSTGTFTTLGYGDFHPIGAMRYLAALESFVGATLLSLFTVIVARKLIRD
jgi:uncharacterized protein YjbI with pentapeptide repeats